VALPSEICSFDFSWRFSQHTNRESSSVSAQSLEMDDDDDDDDDDDAGDDGRGGSGGVRNWGNAGGGGNGGDVVIKDPDRLTYKVDGRSAADSSRLRDMRELAGKMANLFGEQNQVVNFVTAKREGEKPLVAGYFWELQTMLHKISQQYFRRRSM
jgi:hypothetical protein